jgi:NAD(P)H-dependent flavin oxidoreductase YrpB (nitropropane dioxygenase family)
MSRVSDTSAFAAAVGEAGGLPVMAVAAMREDELETMLRETGERMGQAPWGAGLLGFLPPELYGAQVELVKKYRPPAVVIAGGRPVQAQQLEKEGIERSSSRRTGSWIYIWTTASATLSSRDSNAAAT